MNDRVSSNIIINDWRKAQKELAEQGIKPLADLDKSYAEAIDIANCVAKVIKTVFPERDAIDCMIYADTFCEHYDGRGIVGFMEYAKINDTDDGSIRATLGHDLSICHKIAETDKVDEFFLPRTSDYVKYYNKESNDE